MTKYGLLYYKDTDNIGDDIQSYAASRFLPQIDYLIDRENIMGFIPKDNENVKVIMNAWYIHDKYRFGISPFINPLLISMHLKSFPYEDGLTIKNTYLTNSILNYLKKYGPVGARDYNTCELLSELGIENYFSGCMTLTLEKFNNVKKEDYVCAVNITKEELEILKTKTNNKIIEINQDIEIGSLSNKTWEERKNNVERLLKLYQGAEFVVTTKLHCALPCLALETNVLVLYDEKFNDRMKTFKEYFNYVDRDKFKDININDIKNTNKYKILRENLIRKCTDYIKQEIEEKNIVDINTYKMQYEISDEKIKFMKKNIEELGITYREECKKSDIIIKENNKYLNELNNANKKLKELNNILIEKNNENILLNEKIIKIKEQKEYIENTLENIYNSNSWKLITKLLKFKQGIKKNYIKINNVYTIDNKLVIKHEVHGNAKKFFEENKYIEIEYDFNLDKIPKSILCIPFLSLFLPVAWITKSDIILDEIDLSFYNNINKIRKALNTMYKGNIFKKINIKTKKIIENKNKGERYSLFFSGGVESLNTLVSNNKKNPLLVMISGSDIWLEDEAGWETAKDNLEKVSKDFKKETSYIKSNFRKVINELKLNEVYQKKLGDNWWHGIEHGMALLGHIAPLAHKFNIKTHFIPGTFNAQIKNVKCVSYPTIDENFKFANTNVIHDGFEMTRLAKVKNIVRFIKKNNLKIQFRTCYMQRETKINCCKCEKCYRTIMELVSIGENPNDYGYTYNKTILKNIAILIKEKKFEHSTTKLYWEEIQEEIKKNKYYDKLDISWLKKINFKE